MMSARRCSRTPALSSSPSAKSANNHQGCVLTKKQLFTDRNQGNLAQYAQGHVDGGQQGSKRRCHVRVEGRGGEAEHKQGSVFGQVHTLKEEGRAASSLTAGHRKTSQQSTDLVQENLAAVWGEVLQRGECFAQDLQQTALHRQQSLLLSLLSARLPSTGCLFRRGVWGPLCSGQRSGG